MKLISLQKENILHGKEVSLSATAGLTKTAIWSAVEC